MEFIIRSREINVSAPQASCPVCGGLLLNVGGFCRCSRCCYSLCESCEGECEDEFIARNLDES